MLLTACLALLFFSYLVHRHACRGLTVEGVGFRLPKRV
jgi:hypothetical protein